MARKPRRASKSEKAILNETLVDVTALPDSVFFRNNTGMAWQGREVDVRIGSKVTVESGMKILREARPVHFGLLGSGDILGAVMRRPVALEIKDEFGQQTADQKTFQRLWEKAGGIYILARSRDDALAQLLIRLVVGP